MMVSENRKRSSLNRATRPAFLQTDKRHRSARASRSNLLVRLKNLDLGVRLEVVGFQADTASNPLRPPCWSNLAQYLSERRDRMR